MSELIDRLRAESVLAETELDRDELNRRRLAKTLADGANEIERLIETVDTLKRKRKEMGNAVLGVVLEAEEGQTPSGKPAWTIPNQTFINLALTISGDRK